MVIELTDIPLPSVAMLIIAAPEPLHGPRTLYTEANAFAYIVTLRMTANLSVFFMAVPLVHSVNAVAPFQENVLKPGAL